MAEIVLDPNDLDRIDGPLVFAVAGTLDAESFSAPPHRHARGQLMGSIRGLLSVAVENGLWVVPAIHAVWLPPGHLHTAHAHGAFNGWSVFVEPSACQDLPDRPCTLRTSNLLQEAVLRAAQWGCGDHLDAAQQHIAEVVVDEIRSMPVEALGLPLPQDPRLLRISQAYMVDPSDNRDLNSWASWAAVSPRTLSRRFVQETGFSFTTWRQRVRLLRALELLAADVPVTTIALDLGYSTGSAFIGLFRKTFGVTPAMYRRQS